MNQKILGTIYDNEEDRQLARILAAIIWASFSIYIFVISAGFFYNNDRMLIGVALAGGALQIMPLMLLRRQYLRASSLIVVLGNLAAVTIIATIGQGIRDLAIVGFPVILIFASLTLTPAFFRLCVGLELAAVCWLVFGENYGWFVTKPFDGDFANWLYLIGTTLLLLVTALAIDLLTTNARKNLELARQEITQRKRVEEELKNSERRFHVLIEHGRDNISLLAADGTLLWENPSLNHILGYTADQFKGHNIFELMHPDDQVWVSSLYAQVVQTSGSIQQGEFRLRHADGTWRWIECSATNLLDNPSVQAIAVNYRDISARKRAEDELFQKKSMLDTIMESISESIFVKDIDGKYIVMNEAGARTLGYSVADVIGRTDLDLLPLETANEFRKMDADTIAGGQMYEREEIGKINGKTIVFLAHKTPWRDNSGKILGVIGVSTDITVRKQAEELLLYQGTHDALTGIYNRTFFEVELARFERSREYPTSIIIADMDYLKVANDTQGHAVGDQLLRNAANALRSAFRESDVLARIGGDEFAVLLPSTDSKIAEQIMSRIKQQLAEHNIKHPELPIQLSLGMATAEKNNITEALEIADRRMYADKAARKSKANH